MGPTSGGVARIGVLGTVGVSEVAMLEKEGWEASEEEATVVAEGSSIEGSSRVGTEEDSWGGTSGLLFMLSVAGGVSGSSTAGVRGSLAGLPSGVAVSVSLLPESSLVSAKVEGDEGAAGVDDGEVEGDDGFVEGDDGVVEGDECVTEDAGVVDTEDVDVGETDDVGMDDVGNGDGDDVDECEDCDVEADEDETDVVGVVLDGGGGGGGVTVVDGVAIGELSTVMSSSGEVVTTSGGRSEVVSGGRRSTGRGIPVANGLATTGVTREASEGGRGARNGGRVLATN